MNKTTRTIPNLSKAQPIEHGLSPLAKALAGRARHVHEFDIAGFFGIAGQPVPKLGIRVPVKAEQDKAIRGAHLAIQAKADGVDTAKNDEDLTRDTKLVHLLHFACVDPTPKDSGAGQIYHDPAFPSPGWMDAHLTTDQIATLINLLHGARHLESGAPELDDVTVERFIEAAATAPDERAIIELLAACGREMICAMFVIAARKLTEARMALDESASISCEPQETPVETADAG